MSDNPDLERIVVDALSALQVGDLSRAMSLVDEAETLSPADRDVALMRAAILIAQGDAEGAAALYDRLLAEHPHDPMIVAAKAGLLMDVLDDPETALALLEDTVDEMLEGSSDDDDDDDDADWAEATVELLLRMAECRSRLGDFIGALEAAEQAFAISPDSIEAKFACAKARFDLSEIDVALTLVDDVLAEDDEIADAWFLRGHMLALLGRDEEAAESFARAVDLDPEGFAVPTTLPADRFEAALRAAMQGLPPELLSRITMGSAMHVVDWPDVATWAEDEGAAESPATLLSTLRGDDDRFSFTFYRRNFEVAGVELAEVTELARDLLMAEIEETLSEVEAPMA